ncbi:MAG: phage Gp37/Gp68 family protein [Planctomycetaceae bacterium]|nr:phage Gp37/Gp68 family protein [Planctomycetaceae bacterium]
MSETTAIPWCDSTVNFWSGCTEVSPGCANCYAEKLSHRLNGVIVAGQPGRQDGRQPLGKWGKGAPRKLHETAFSLALRLNKKPWVCDECGNDYWHMPIIQHMRFCGGTLHRRRVFSLSLGDWLDPEVSDGWWLRMMHTIWSCRDTDFLLVTKRPELWRGRLMSALGAITDGSGNNADFWQWLVNWLGGVPPSNVWVIATAEYQPCMDERAAYIAEIPAIVRGLSLEPLLGPIQIDLRGINWVIVGGESGPQARPCNVEWIRDIVRQCVAAGVPCFVKQLGANVHGDPRDGFTCDYPTPEFYRARLKHPKGGDMDEWPEDLRVREVPKGAAR